ncbi:BQ2448_7497 [Microbotryum intermedium]|uniref:BQ2448_7497 protein n=1 Tax=Microbotryum intermedium TaxID=269621 RepID=A0A238FN39_9BASI|nr:BQ2448_7497 [Microbotryum intermedium]
MSELNPSTAPLKTPNSPSPALPPTPQDVKRRLSVLAPRVDVAATQQQQAATASDSTSTAGQSQFAPASPLMPTCPSATLDPSMGGKKSQASSSALSSSGMSSTSEDEADPSSSTAAQARHNNQVPLSAISEADSGTDSDASSDARGGARTSSRRTRALGVPADQVTKAMERLRISRENSRLAESVALKGGYLMKKGERRKAWKRRWFVLRGGQLAMYKNEKEYRLLRLIPLADIHTCSPIELKKHVHTFGIVTPKRTYYVKADSEKDVRDWCQAVQRAKTDLATSTTVTSLTEGTSGDVTPLGKEARSPGLQKHAPSPPSLSTATMAEQGGSFLSSPELQPMHHFPSSPIAVTAPINDNEGASGLSSSYTSTSSGGGGGGGGAGLAIPGVSGSTIRGGSTAPPNSFATGAEGALGLRGADGHTLELNAVDAELSTAIARQGSQHRSSSTVSDRSTGRDSYLAVVGTGATAGDYFGGPSRTSMSLNPPLSPGGGGASSSEDEDGFDTYDATWAGSGSAPPASPGPVSRSQSASRQLTFAEQPSTPSMRSPLPNPNSTPTAPSPSTPASGFTDPNKVILSGYLMKQGKRKTWRKRWFVLMSTRLVYSRSHMDAKIHRQIPLTKILDAIEHEPTKMQGSIPGTPLLGNGGTLGGGGGGGGGNGVGGSSSNTMPNVSGSEGRGGGGGAAFDHCFKIITPKRTFLVCAPSEEDEIKWLAALQCLVQRKNGTNPAVVGGVATLIGGTSGPANPNASSGAGVTVGTGTGVPTLVGTAPPVTRRASALGMGRKRSITNAAKEAVDEVESRFHPQESG